MDEVKQARMLIPPAYRGGWRGMGGGPRNDSLTKPQVHFLWPQKIPLRPSILKFNTIPCPKKNFIQVVLLVNRIAGAFYRMGEELVPMAAYRLP